MSILIDVAGSYEAAPLTVAAARAHLTIIPATLTEADVFEAAKNCPSHPANLRVLRPRAPLPASPHAGPVADEPTRRKHAAKELKRFRLPLLQNVLAQRAACERKSACPAYRPTSPMPKGPTVAKALCELKRAPR